MKIFTGFLFAVAVLASASATDCDCPPPCIDNLSRKCRDAPPTDPCPEYFDPVCGTDDRDYDNMCLLHNESLRREAAGEPAIRLAYGGPCVCDCTYCPKCYRPVCGVDGRSYWNSCWACCYDACNQRRNQPRIWIVHSGYCQPT